MTLRSWFAGLVVLAPFGLARGAEPTAPVKPAVEESGISLLDAARSGAVAVEAVGTGGGTMTIKVTNQTNRRLKVVLPPGLVASGATGQMGGMGGMGGGGMGGGMGGMGGGGMGGGGMGGGGMGGGGMGGGGMGGGGMGGGGGQRLTMPATQGMMMLANLIFQLVEPTESWDRRSFMMGMGGMMGGMGGGMGGMGGGMGGMGGGMGGMGGGMRSVPPTDLPSTTLAPGQARSLPTAIVSLNAPAPDGSIVFPAKGEPLQLGDVAQLDASPKYRAALRRLARDKAPESVSQIVLWAVGGMSWTDIAEISRGSKGWINAHELALAKQLVADLDAHDSGDTGRLLIEVTADDARSALATTLRAKLVGASMLGLAVEPTVPVRPAGPAVACKVVLGSAEGQPEATVSVATSDAAGSTWAAVGKFTLPVAVDAKGVAQVDGFADALADELLKRLVKVTLVKPKAAAREAKLRETYTVRVENYSPLMLNGIALTGVGSKPTDAPKALVGIALSPRRTLALPAPAEAIERSGMKDGVKVLALDLSGL